METALRNRTKKSGKTGKISLLNLLFLLVAGAVNAFGVTIFLFPVKLYDSGISGLSMLLDQLTPPALALPVFLLCLNVPVFLFGLRKEGTSFTAYSLFAVGAYSLFAYLICNVLPIDTNLASPLAGKDLLLCSIFGGVISGIGSGLVIRFGGAIDGIDLLSVLFAKRLGLSIGSFTMIFNFLLYVVCGFALESWILPLYSIITYFVASKTIDFIVDGIDREKCAMIVTTEAEKINIALTENFGSAGTTVNAIGGYTKSEKQIVYFVLNHFQVNSLKRIARTCDPGAFVSLLDISDAVRANAPKQSAGRGDPV